MCRNKWGRKHGIKILLDFRMLTLEPLFFLYKMYIMPLAYYLLLKGVKRAISPTKTEVLKLIMLTEAKDSKRHLRLLLTLSQLDPKTPSTAFILKWSHLKH